MHDFTPSVTIVIPSYNGKEHLALLLPSLQRLDYPPENLEIVVVDDCSQDGTGEWIQKHWSSFVRYTCNEKNVGFAGTCNAGARCAQGEWVIFLNNDTHVDSYFVKGFMEVVNPSENIVAGAGKILDWQGQKIDFVKGTHNIFGKGFNMYAGEEYEKENWNVPYRLPFACGGAMIIKRDIFLEVGGFDEDYFIIFEDVDLGWRLSLQGYQTHFCPRSITYHRLHSYLKTVNLQKKVYLHEKNALMTIIKNYDEENYKKIIPVAFMLLGGVAHANTLEGKYFSRGDYYTQSPPSYSFFDKFRKYVKQLFHPRFDYYTDLSRTGYGALRVFPYLLEMWPLLMKKRTAVQKNRRVKDEDILPLFEDHYTPWLYSKNYLGFWDFQSFQQFLARCRDLL